MTCTNASATLPFGAIDTPEQGGVASGSAYVNFGWALTPLPKTIPTDGSTISVLVDGVAIGTASYSNLRPDIASLFPGLNNSNGAIGFRVLDTTTLTNGTHTISWVVSDNQGATEGIGSRFFTVSNGTGSLTSAVEATPTLDAPTGTRAASGQALHRRSHPNASSCRSTATWFSVAAVGTLNAPFRPVSRDASGRTIVRSEEVSRVELQLGAGPHVGYLRTSDGPSPLPVGSHLEPTTGVFTWAPGVGFVGSLRFRVHPARWRAGGGTAGRSDRHCTKGQRIDWRAGGDRHAALAAGRRAAVRAGRVVGGFECDTRHWRCDAACMGLSVVRWSARIPRSDELRLHAAGRGRSARRPVRRVGLRATRSRTAAWELRPGGLRVEYRDRRVSCPRRSSARPYDRTGLVLNPSTTASRCRACASRRRLLRAVPRPRLRWRAPVPAGEGGRCHSRGPAPPPSRR